MQANKVSVIVAAVIASAAVALTAGPSKAQSTAPEARAQAVRAAAHPPARITVRKRSYLDPGTETKRHAEHYTDYSHPTVEYGFAPFRNSTLFTNGPTLPFWHDRMPFPTCLDLAGYCD